MDGGRGEESITFEREQGGGSKVAVRPSGKYIVDLPKSAGPEGALTMAGGHIELGRNVRKGNLWGKTGKLYPGRRYPD